MSGVGARYILPKSFRSAFSALVWPLAVWALAYSDTNYDAFHYRTMLFRADKIHAVWARYILP